MSKQTPAGDPGLGEIAERDAAVGTLADQQAEAAETMEDHQRLLFEKAQRIAELERSPE
jgi:hypothetical protein